ncbi:2OG-Fe(II) oxygenase [Kordiimonas pumila]|uniref:2OG-Fe(II) oxygenase n=1 Tax=Kordiimonas pumila TaxID=2161677 RepID=A0ABV7D6J9_9PROT|nr:2OG-Fe(II) oxygenase [Kordiimonas pumila]
MEHFFLEGTGALDTGDACLLFASIADDIQDKGYSCQPGALPSALSALLWQQVGEMPPVKFREAGVGRAANHTVDSDIRRDQICWITGASVAGKAWLDWAENLQAYLNKHLFLGLFSFESHYAHYPEGGFYAQHQDAFKGEANRVVSVVVYLNPDWMPGDGGELVLYDPEGTTELMRIAPTFGTIAVFLSEDFPHEVLPTNRDRFSIAGWYRLNGFNPLISL